MPKILTLTKNILLAVGGVIIALTVLSYIAFYIFEYEAEASFGIPPKNPTGQTHVSTAPTPALQVTPSFSPYAFTWVPLPTIAPTAYTPVTSVRSQVKGVSVVAISAADRQAPDFIQNHLVPLTVEQVFQEVFEYRINPELSTYWKGRARSDKATVSKLRGAMYFHKAKGLFAPNWKIG